jgi:hypothetical protein
MRCPIDSLLSVPSLSMDSTSTVTEPELLCPLCEYNLRGLTEPRCPECGHRSTWEELKRDQPNHPYLFERHPQRNVWSFWRTLLGSLRPRKFWRELSPTVRPVPRRLLIFCAIIVALGILGTLMSTAVTVTQWAQWNATARQRWVQDMITGTTPGPRFNPNQAQTRAVIESSGQTLQSFARSSYPGPTDIAFWRNFWRWGVSDQMTGGILIALWPPFTFASLMIFRASLRQAKIKPMHVVRCVVYTASILAFISVLYIAIAPLVYLFPELGYRQVFMNDWAAIMILGLLVILCYRLGVAYSKYLRFDKPYLTALASQVMVLLALWKVALAMHGW